MQEVRIVYKKPTGSFITVESEFKSFDDNFYYLACGKYLKRNVISIKEIKKSGPKEDDGLTDDA